MHYQKLVVWQESIKLTIFLHNIFKGCKDYGLKDQIMRSAVSIPSNIAEGEERETIRESVRFLYIAKGSAGELLTQLILAKHFGYLNLGQYQESSNKLKQISRMLAGLIKSRVQKVK